MTPEVKERIDQLRHSIVPEGYKKTKAGIVPVDWKEYTIGECMKRVERPVDVQPDEMYTQIGIRSHGKGLFYKEPVTGESLGNKLVFWVEPDCLVLNIVFAWEQAIGKITQAEEGMIGSHRFPMYQPFDGKVDIDYLISFFMTKRGKDILEAASPGGAGRNRTLGQDRFMKSKIVLPALAEQSKIAKILTMQDKVIELHQKEIDELKRLKRAYLSKMFPQKGENVPELRFKGFTEDWEQRKLGEVIIEYKEPVDTNCTLPVLTSSKTEGVILQEEHFGRKQNHDITGYNVLPRSYCTYRNRSDGVDFTFNVNKCCDKGIISKFYPVFYGNNSDTFFVSLVLNNSDEVIREIGYTCAGTGQKVLSFSDLQKMNIRVPSYEEQKKIASYFEILDNFITLHQRKLEQEKQKKKALMQLLLTGIVRV